MRWMRFICLLLAATALTTASRAGGREAALVNAVKAGDLDRAKALVAEGADPNAVIFDAPPVMWAAHGGRVDLLAFLVSKGANPNGT